MLTECKVLIEVGGLARRLGVSRGTVLNEERAGRLPAPFRLESSGRRCWTVEQVEQILERRKAAGAAG